jgi:hypothetical protein
MITGEVLFTGKSLAGMMTRHLMDGPEFPKKWFNDVPQEVTAVLAQALAKESNERYPSTTQFAKQLRQLETRKVSLVEEDSQPRDQKSPTLPNRLPWTAAGVIILLMTIVLLALSGVVSGIMTGGTAVDVTETGDVSLLPLSTFLAENTKTLIPTSSNAPASSATPTPGHTATHTSPRDLTPTRQ